MPKFRDTILLAHASRLINAEEFVLLYDLHKPKNPDLPYTNYECFDLDKMTDDECKTEFRFYKNDIYNLAEVFTLPDRIVCYNGVNVDMVEALCIFLKRFAYPCRYVDMIPRFGRPEPQLCMISNAVMNKMYQTWNRLLTDLNQDWLRPDHLEEFAVAVHNRGAALDNCWGFVDGTVRPICRPGQNQKCLYNGHKKVHAIKFQSIAAPSGLVANLFGLVEGKRHDSGMSARSGVLNQLQRFSVDTNGNPLCIYGDPAYPLRLHLQGPFRGAGLTPIQSAWNESMSEVRVSVEWIFGDIINYFKFLDFKKNLKISLSAVGKMYVTCALLHNARVCCYGSTTSDYFDVSAPEIRDYFH